MLKSENNSERRQFTRKLFAEPVSFQFISPEKFGGSLSADLSEGGVRLKVPQYVAPGTEMFVQLQLEDLRFVELIGKVAWAEKDRFNEWYQIGVKFEDDENGVLPRENIHRFIKKID